MLIASRVSTCKIVYYLFLLLYFFYTCLPECLYATYVPHDCGVLDRTRDALKLKLQKAVNPYVDAGN